MAIAGDVVDAGTTLSLADVARLARVARPVVTMWRKRQLPNAPFPAPDPRSRFDARAVADWLERTGRGNNPHPRADLALDLAAAPATPPERLRDLLHLVAARAVTDRSLRDLDPEDLLDLVDAIDPDDEWLFGELERADIDGLSADADAIVDAAWSAPAAYERLLDAITQRDAATPGTAASPERLASPLVAVVAGLAAPLLRTDTLVDVGGAGADVVLAMRADEDFAEFGVLLVGDADRLRSARRRYRVHGVRTRVGAMTDDWTLRAGTVVVCQVGRDPREAFDQVDQIALQLPADATAIIVGPAVVLVDDLTGPALTARDALLRRRTLQAAVRLPQGLTRSGSREHLALWLLSGTPSDTVQVADLSGERLSPATSQMLLDDLLAVVRPSHARAFGFLVPVPVTRLLARSSALTSVGSGVRDDVTTSAADDAVRILQLVDAVPQPLTREFHGIRPQLGTAGPRTEVSLGDVARSRQVTVIPGLRIDALPTGSTRLWTGDALAEHAPRGVDLLALTRVHPTVRLTEPDDVIFTTHGQPRAVVDAEGGAAVAYPARILRVGSRVALSPRAIAEAINRVPAGNAKWRTWRVPTVHGRRDTAEDLLRRLDCWEDQLRTRQAQVAELRRLIIRSVLPGALSLTRASDDTDTSQTKGH